MSQDVLLVLIPALIALVGTLLTIYVTVRMQRQHTHQDTGKQFTTDQQAAYKALWDLLEEIHIQFRTDEAALAKYSGAVTRVNAFLIKNALYLDDQDQTLSTSYLSTLKKLTEIVNKYRDDVPQLADGWDSTATFSSSMVQQFQQEEQTAFTDLEATRKQILDKCRRVLKGA